MRPTEKWPLLLFYAESRALITFHREAVNTCHFLILFVFHDFSIVVFTILFLWGFFVMTLYSSYLPADISNNLFHGVANVLKLKVTWFTINKMGNLALWFFTGES